MYCNCLVFSVVTDDLFTNADVSVCKRCFCVDARAWFSHLHCPPCSCTMPSWADAMAIPPSYSNLWFYVESAGYMTLPESKCTHDLHYSFHQLSTNYLVGKPSIAPLIAICSMSGFKVVWLQTRHWCNVYSSRLLWCSNFCCPCSC